MFKLSQDRPELKNLNGKIILDHDTGRIRYNGREPVINPAFDLWVVRHGETDINLVIDENGERAFSGWSDELNEKGKRQAVTASVKLYELLKPLLMFGEEIIVITSKLSRAQHTAKAFTQYVDQKGGWLKYVEDERLNEINMGIWASKTPQELPGERPKIDRWRKKADALVTPERGENFFDLLTRTKEALRDYNQDYTGKTVVLFVHATVITAIKMNLRDENLVGETGYLAWCGHGIANAAPVKLN